MHSLVFLALPGAAALGGADGTSVVEQAARDPLTIPAVRDAIRSLTAAKKS